MQTRPQQARHRRRKQAVLTLERSLRLVSSSVLAGIAVAGFIPACGNASSTVPPHVAAHTGASHRAASPFPVRWEPTLLDFIGSDAAVDQRQSTLATVLAQQWESGLQLASGQRTVEVSTCRALLDLDNTYEPVVPSQGYIHQYRREQCRAGELVVHGQPARTSFLRDFTLDAQAPKRLPAAFAFSVSPQDAERVSEATGEGQPWTAVEDVHLLEQTSPRDALYGDNASEQRIVIAARGDFSGDGIDDLLLLSSGHLTHGSLKSTRLFLLTLDQPDEPILRLLPLE
jgi:hypothetical protein